MTTIVNEDPNEDGLLDDMFISGDIQSFHIEQMDKGHWWFAVYLNDGSRHSFNLYSKKKITARHEHEEAVPQFPIDGGRE